MKNKIVQLKNMYKDSNRKNTLQIMIEVIKLWRESNTFPIHYFTRLGYKKNRKNFRNYLDNKTINQIHNSSKIHNEKTIRILENKVNFNKFCISHNIPTPKTIAFNIKKEFNYDEEIQIIENINDFLKILNVLLISSKTENVFAKPLDGMQGKGCFKINTQTLKNKTKILKMYQEISENNYVFQETINQHNTLNKINSSSINTIRMDTYIDKNNRLYVMSALMRFGRQNSIVDNPFESGGFFVSIDLKNGVLNAPGLQLLSVGNNEFHQHPDTNYILDEFNIPYFNEAIELVKETASILEHKLVGWDIAITENGPLIIEGNHNYHIGMQEAAFGGYKNHPVFKEIFKEL